MKEPRPLRPLHRRLARLRRRRRWFRWATAASAVAIAALWALGLVFALDWCFQRNVDFWQRLLLLGFAAAGVICAFVFLALPWLGKREDETDMALLTQRLTGIDSDLVAALQFESADAARWGSKQLQGAVIDRVATRQQDFAMNAGVPRRPLIGRLCVLLATVVVWALLGVFAPEHLRVFFQRLAFGSQHYPSRTQVVAIAIEVNVNGKIKRTSVDLSAAGETAVRVPWGKKVTVEVTVRGATPESGRVELLPLDGGSAGGFPLDRASAADASQLVERAADEPPLAKYKGDRDPLNQSVRCRIHLGDAWADPLLLRVIPLPTPEIQAEVVPPAYARQSAAGTPYSGSVRKLPRGMRQFSVLAGSEVCLTLDNEQPLQAAEVIFAHPNRDRLLASDVTLIGPSLNLALDWVLATAGKELAEQPLHWALTMAGEKLAEAHYAMHLADAQPDGRQVWTLAVSCKPNSAVEMSIAGVACCSTACGSLWPSPQAVVLPAPRSMVATALTRTPLASLIQTPLASVAEDLPFSIQVRDDLGQTSVRPLEGSVSIEADMPPGITATTKTPVVLPTGSPNIHYEAGDDHALGRIWLTWEATADETSSSADVSSAAENREGQIEVWGPATPKVWPRNLEGDFPLPLEKLPLKKGDTLRVVFHVSDYRGPAAAATVDTEPPLVFQVTDLPGFLASQYEADQKTASGLEDIHKKHTRVGEKQ